ncbi:MAG TPA: hypothetical protein VEV64_12045 [Rhizomicrobium sp.]|jgi:hypothetical protein|nr:hypothetical protein [Rhizomicrobium sp.]
MSEIQPVRPGSPEFYRSQAAQMLKKADEAATAEARATFLNLAENWHRLAKQAEEPSW